MEKHEKYLIFEKALRDLYYRIPKSDLLSLCELDHAIIVFLMKDSFGETGVVFLENLKTDCNNSINSLKNKYPKYEETLQIISRFIYEFIITE